jgi:hypothetical protein
MNRITTVLAAAVAAFLLASPMAWADDVPVVTDPFTGEVIECFDAPYEYEPGLWVCTSVADAVEWGFDTPAEEPDEVTPEDFVALADEEPEPEPVEPQPEPEPVDIVEGDGDWGWSDAREMYRG